MKHKLNSYLGSTGTSSFAICPATDEFFIFFAGFFKIVFRSLPDDDDDDVVRVWLGWVGIARHNGAATLLVL